ncbi:10732_t:CDS:2, partial [Racocetra persica]
HQSPMVKTPAIDILTVVVETSAIDIESDSNDLSSLLTTKVSTITNLELSNI